MLTLSKITGKSLNMLKSTKQFATATYNFLERFAIKRCAYEGDIAFFWTATPRKQRHHSHYLYQDVFLTPTTLDFLVNSETADVKLKELYNLIALDYFTPKQTETPKATNYGKDSFIPLFIFFKLCPAAAMNNSNWRNLQILNTSAKSSAAVLLANPYTPTLQQFVLPTKIVLFFGQVVEQKLYTLSLYPWEALSIGDALSPTDQFQTPYYLDLAKQSNDPLELLLLEQTAKRYSCLNVSNGKISWYEGNGQSTACCLEQTLEFYPKSATLFKLIFQELDAYVNGDLRSFSIPCALALSPFQTSCLKALADIPFGKTCSYSRLARKVLAQTGKSDSDIRKSANNWARAIGQTLANNPLSLIYPCHRVIGADHKLVGYSHGLDCKAALLAHELHVLNEKN